MNLSYFYIIFNKIGRKIQKILRIPTLGVRAIVVNQNNEILLVKHSYGSGWHLPGGGVKRGESYRAALSRELKEEVGIYIEGEPEILGVYITSISGAIDYPIAYVVKAFKQIDASSPEIAASIWVRYDKLPEHTTPGTKRRLNEYFNKVDYSERW